MRHLVYVQRTHLACQADTDCLDSGPDAGSGSFPIRRRNRAGAVWRLNVCSPGHEHMFSRLFPCVKGVRTPVWNERSQDFDTKGCRDDRPRNHPDIHIMGLQSGETCYPAFLQPCGGGSCSCGCSFERGSGRMTAAQRVSLVPGNRRWEFRSFVSRRHRRRLGRDDSTPAHCSPSTFCGTTPVSSGAGNELVGSAPTSIDRRGCL